MLYKENAHDYHVRYQGSYLIWKKSDTVRLPVFVNEFHDDCDEIKAKVIVYPTPPTKSYNKTLPIEELIFCTLNRGCINLSSSVFIINENSPQSGEAKHRKGLTKHNSQIIDPFKQEREMLHSIPFSFDNGTVLNALITNTYAPAEECLENVVTFKRLGQAFHPDYFFGLKYRPNSVMIFRRDYMIGRVNQKGVVTLPKMAHPFYEELSEFGLTVEKTS